MERIATQEIAGAPGDREARLQQKIAQDQRHLRYLTALARQPLAPDKKRVVNNLLRAVRAGLRLLRKAKGSVEDAAEGRSEDGCQADDDAARSLAIQAQIEGDAQRGAWKQMQAARSRSRYRARPASRIQVDESPDSLARVRARHVPTPPPAVMGIYCIRNKRTGAVYVGKSRNVAIRWGTHFKELQSRRSRVWKLQAAWNEHGPENFEVEVLEVVEDQSLLASAEERWIERCRASVDPNYNLSQLGTGGSDKPWENALFSEYRTLVAKEQIDIQHPTKFDMARFRRRMSLSRLTLGLIARPEHPEAEYKRSVARAQARDQSAQEMVADQILGGLLSCPVPYGSRDQLLSLVEAAIEIADERERASGASSLGPPSERSGRGRRDTSRSRWPK